MIKQTNLVTFSSPSPSILRAALWMMGFALFFSFTSALVRHLSGQLHPVQIAFFRNIFGLVFILPLLIKSGFSVLHTHRFSKHLARAVTGLTAMFLLFAAVSLMPLAEATAMTFTAPLFATLGAALFLNEKVRIRRWSATIIGFIGALVMLRPGFAHVSTPALIALSSAAFIAMSMLLVKSLSRTERPETMVFYMTFIMAVLSLPAALYVWSPVPDELWVWLILLGIVATTGQFFMAKAFGYGEASEVLPFDFSRLIFAAIVGFFIFNETPDFWTWVGGGIIFTSTVYIARRESLQQHNEK